MSHPNLIRICAATRGSDICSVSWARCWCSGGGLSPSFRVAGERVGWPRLVACAGAEGAGDSTPAAKKGFGSPRKVVKQGVKKSGSSRGNPQEKGVLLNNADRTADREGSSHLSKVIDVVDKKASGHRVSRLHIDPNEAKKGKVDFVRVQTWGEDEESGKLENLKVKSFSPAVTSSSKKSGPFYEKLVNRLQLLESKGEMSVAQAKPLPSFDRWVFGEERYMQFLMDQRAVFQALRDVIASIHSERCGSVAVLEDGLALGGATKAVSLFAEDLGLDRCKALDLDISFFTELLTARGEQFAEFPTPTTQAVGYAKYIRQLGASSLEKSDKAKDACLKFLAHVFSVYVSHLTTGMRIGAKAMDNIAILRQANAVSFYRDYPLEGKDPLKLFIQTINSAGLCILSEEDHEQVMEELPKAMQRTSLLLSVLAVEEKLLTARD
ncbi:hypothetical protein MPTK1_6g20090 [Marchantia polymorpha subsp. ruderalis]|uniref:heme oxygenase (biliverdin-producing) n=2 Tax=Marchantia polymorpha TaxID=3197 RepID=A0A176VTB3_MARPO|nr:hypothetical protein AXG93_1660s1130 [Marchantia polymorpha subsp. ruderalis]PTQ39387.1 hypothetical protein MARPO_0045s0055 [Marchantia polymorpha]BBN15502.1 hypothetical protein Mp_6g20090 [Marchantia polymorpha subsp. ruderalis]|eukprot:PTQ39387.1 hypothetical protein MARPO_0045s0055 [Marchantia polymorpha]